MAQKRAYSYIFIRGLVELKIGGDNGLALLFQTFGAHLPFSITNPHMKRIVSFFLFSFELCLLKLCIYSGSEPIAHIRTAIVMRNGDQCWMGREDEVARESHPRESYGLTPFLSVFHRRECRNTPILIH